MSKAVPTLLALGALLCGPSSQVRADGPEADTEPQGQPDALRVLLVGNSYSHHNELPRMLERLAAADAGGPGLEAQLVFIPGATLERHWRTRKARQHLQRGEFTHVVLQGHSLDTFDHPKELRRYVTRFHEAAVRAGAETLLYATWARHRDNVLYMRGEVGESPAEMQDHIDRTYGRIARSIEARVAPVGRAWRNALERFAQMTLHRPDGSHPTRRGSYLAACVLYGAISGRSPEGIGYSGGLDADVAARIQRVAAATLEARSRAGR